jgi:hypothetical protein
MSAVLRSAVIDIGMFLKSAADRSQPHRCEERPNRDVVQVGRNAYRGARLRSRIARLYRFRAAAPELFSFDALRGGSSPELQFVDLIGSEGISFCGLTDLTFAPLNLATHHLTTQLFQGPGWSEALLAQALPEDVRDSYGNPAGD